MGLLFNADNEQVECGNSSAINNLNAGSIAVWGHFNTLANDEGLAIKWQFSAGHHDFVFWGGPANNLTLTVGRGTANLEAVSNDGCIASTGKWYFMACVWDISGANSEQKLYFGDLTTPTAEVGSYSTQTVGSGSRNSSTENLGLGGMTGGSPAWFNNDVIIDVVAIFDKVLSLAELRMFQFHPQNNVNCVGLWYPGKHGPSVVPDLSGQGNHGTVYNATMDISVPLGPFFGADA